MTVLEQTDLKASIEAAGIIDQSSLVTMHLDEIEGEGERVLDLIVALRSAGRLSDWERAEEALVDLTVSLEHLRDHAAHVVPLLTDGLGLEGS